MGAQKLKVLGVEEQYEIVKKKRNRYLFLTILMMILPFAGYAFYHGLEMPTRNDVLYFPLNFGIYGIIGGVLALLVLFIFLAIWLVIESGLILGLIKAVVLYCVVFGLGIGLLEVAYSSADWRTVFSNWGIADIFYIPIHGIGEVLGAAVIGLVIYVVPLVIFLLKAIRYCGKAAQLKGPAQEAIAHHELAAQQAEEERNRQKKRKEQEEKERREYERYILAQAKAMNANAAPQEYKYFDGCTSAEQAWNRFEKMMQIYDASDGSGNPVIANEIRKQYEEFLDYHEHDGETEDDSQEHDGETEDDSQKHP